ncbi:hypothetical protein GUITHDRAFT_102936 [Guillardia theta CCMP2712]|uniref:Uncharacterized protein n=1 Tax=Guillardia theta (strain CCMP2712) TaxID=905079 RepID=L1JTA2_GUITC|nr:hypothetical protein GUITHDRAFT_102936 [Guillardia theta CCMP2712]EKX51672.1 hypothetical protein GUITHDRAFT_102936 [Guillardia theta CCMP2712]|eukprot:XP_005838652.1 hypothetical protein GUITHDRAFT_102936 [Guillardia theta CCMP2712]
MQEVINNHTWEFPHLKHTLKFKFDYPSPIASGTMKSDGLCELSEEFLESFLVDADPMVEVGLREVPFFLGYTPQRTVFSTIEDLRDEVRADISRLGTKIKEMKTEIKEMKTEIKEMKTEIKAIKGDVSEIKVLLQRLTSGA